MTARIEPLQDRNAVAVGRLLAASHLDHPAYEVLWPNPKSRMRALTAYLTVIARDAASWGGAVLAKDGDLEVGVALWLPPGAFPLSAARMARLSPTWLRMGLAAPRPTAALGLLGARMARGDWAEPTWYLRAIGVHPDARRAGVGSLLLAPVLAGADEEGIRCALHASDPRMVPYFQRHGFRTDGRELLVRRGAASYLPMVRLPR
jgi:GNAT superfamily N-acetyltransferase